MKLKFYLSALLLCLLCGSAFSQENIPDTTSQTTEKTVSGSTYTPRKSRTYTTWGGDGPLLSFADNIKNGGEHLRNIPRFTWFFNIGSNYNYDFGNHFGIFTGLNLKNIGLITKDDDGVKLKRRVYTLGIPLGLKIGDLRKRGFFFFAGGSYDLAFNYKEKKFEDGTKRKFNEWFSDRTPLLMPSLFVGIKASPGFGLKVQYYPNNFFNKDYKETVSGTITTPYKELDAKMFFVTLSYDFARSHVSSKHWRKKAGKYKKHWEMSF
jgi:hypothetical protein